MTLAMILGVGRLLLLRSGGRGLARAGGLPPALVAGYCWRRRAVSARQGLWRRTGAAVVIGRPLFGVVDALAAVCGDGRLLAFVYTAALGVAIDRAKLLALAARLFSAFWLAVGGGMRWIRRCAWRRYFRRVPS